MIRGSVVGLGKMGLSHSAIIGAHPDVDLVAVCDTSQFIMSAYKRFSKVKFYTDYQRMIENEELDFVIVATPTKFHFPNAKHALLKGLHVFCEKPFALTTSQGQELVDIVKSKGVVNQSGYHNHFIGTFRELKRLLERNVIGDLVHFSGEAYGPVVTKEKGRTWRSNIEEGGGCLNDYASHLINLIQEIIGHPDKIHGAILKSIYSRGVEDAVYALIELQNGLSGTLLVNWSEETYRKMSTSITIQGKNGKIICDATEIKIYLKAPVESEDLDRGWTIKYITDFLIPVKYYLRGEEYSAQLDCFVDCIMGKRQNDLNTFKQALKTDMVIENIRKKAKMN